MCSRRRGGRPYDGLGLPAGPRFRASGRYHAQKHVLDLRGIYDGDMLQRSHGFIVHTVGRQNTGTADIPKPEMQPVGRIAISGLLPLAKRELADVDTPPLPVMNAKLEELVDG